MSKKETFHYDKALKELQNIVSELDSNEIEMEDFQKKNQKSERTCRQLQEQTPRYRKRPK